MLRLHYPEGRGRRRRPKAAPERDVARKHARASRPALWRPPVSSGLPGCGPAVGSGLSRSPEDLERSPSGTTPRSQVRRLRRNQRGHGGRPGEYVVRRRAAVGGGAPGTATAQGRGARGADRCRAPGIPNPPAEIELLLFFF